MLKFPLWKKLLIVGVLGWAILLALPNALPAHIRAEMPAWLPHDTVNLGLDLQGGSHLVLQVDVETALHRSYENMEDEIRTALRENLGGSRIRYRNLGSTLNKGVTFTLLNPEDADAAFRSIRHALGNSVLITKDDNGAFAVIYTAPELVQMRRHALEQTLEILRLRIDQFGVSEPIIQRQGDDRVIIELPGVEDISRAKSVIGRTAELTFHMVDDSASGAHLPPGVDVFYQQVRDKATGDVIQKIPFYLKRRPDLIGDNLAGATSGFDQYGNPVVNITFDGKGARKFGRLTTDNVGRRMAIVLDGIVYSAPVLREPILGGTAQISGNFTVQEANDLANVLRAGALPAPIHVVEERTVGPSLGQDSIDAGREAVAIGFAAVIVLMMCYGGYGIAANVALLFNVALILGLMTLVGATLTLPGIAGIVLTIGMAVDANVLIFERIREESQRGVSPMAALDSGFKSAFATILDANITTLIAAVVLFGMGSGPIKGFALTLSIGILASMFTAILLTRWILVSWMFRTKPKSLNL